MKINSFTVEVYYFNQFTPFERKEFNFYQLQEFIDYVKSRFNNGAKKVTIQIDRFRFSFKEYSKERMRLIVKLIREIRGDYDEKTLDYYKY